MPSNLRRYTTPAGRTTVIDHGKIADPPSKRLGSPPKRRAGPRPVPRRFKTPKAKTITVSSKPPTRNKGGQPTKLNERVQARMCEAIGAGAPIEVACAHAGIGRQAHYNWMERGRVAKPGDERYVEYMEAISDAQDLGILRVEVNFHRIVGRGSDWRAMERWLQYKCPDRWTRKGHHPIQHHVIHPADAVDERTEQTLADKLRAAIARESESDAEQFE